MFAAFTDKVTVETEEGPRVLMGRQRRNALAHIFNDVGINRNNLEFIPAALRLEENEIEDIVSTDSSNDSETEESPRVSMGRQRRNALADIFNDVGINRNNLEFIPAALRLEENEIEDIVNIDSSNDSETNGDILSYEEMRIRLSNRFKMRRNAAPNIVFITDTDAVKCERFNKRRNAVCGLPALLNLSFLDHEVVDAATEDESQNDDDVIGNEEELFIRSSSRYINRRRAVPNILFTTNEVTQISGR